jgi:methionyl-tRNA formyltransferase
MRIVFIGTGDIGAPTLQALQQSTEHELAAVVTKIDKPVGRDQRIEPPPIKQALAAAKTKIPILQPARIRDRDAIEQVRGLQPDVIVVMAYGQILPREMLQIPSVACLNLHASLLPRWRGAAPVQAAIVAGDRQTGITTMYMDEGLDTGDILLQQKIEISSRDTGGSLHDRLARIAPEALLESLRLLATGNAPRVPQDHALATQAPKLKREDGEIDWAEPANLIEKKIRAYNPWPGTFMSIAIQANEVRNLKIFSATVTNLGGKPGEILHRGDELLVAAGENALSLREVQLEGRRKMTAAEFLRGHPSIARATP